MSAKLTSLLVILLVFFSLLFPSFEKARKEVRRLELQELTLPPLVTKFIALEFRALAADYLFVRVTQFYGGNAANINQNTSNIWIWLYSNLYIVTDLDPYFEDPYYFGNAVLTWKAGMFNQANKLLRKGADARVWDWQFPFYIGFNKFYFLNDNPGAADAILEAAKRPGAPNFLPGLSSRLYNNSGKTQIAIALLNNFLENERNVDLKRIYKTRIEALKGIQLLENAVFDYKRRKGRLPRNIQALITAGIIKEIPKDPYGGSYYLTEAGSVYTTSNLVFTQSDREKIKNK